jgi:hypothetical protein
MTDYYLTSALIIFSLLSVIWTNRTWLNMLIKIGFMWMTGWTLFLQLQSLGYVIKVS